MLAPNVNQVKPELATLIAWIESRGDQFAYRFEPAVYGRRLFDNSLSQIRASNRCSEDSARVIYSSSFGLYQIMGFNLYWPPICWNKTFGEFLNDKDAQTKAFYDFVQHKNIDYTVTQLQDARFAENFAMTYNGSIQYAQAITAALNHFGVKA